MSSRLFVATSLAIGLLVSGSGCATVVPMPFSVDANAPPARDKAIFLMTLTSRNVYKPGYQPKLLVVHVERPVAKDSGDRFNFKIDARGKMMETEAPVTGNSYLVRLQLDQSDYVVRGFTFLNQAFLINASFFAPLHAKLPVMGPGVYYLGHVDATVRERVGNEFAAGGAVPLIDQAVAGASGGTFDVAISDRWDVDGPRFAVAFPGLRQIPIQKIILPPFDRAAAQRWYDTN